jgi:hypothetical protein
LDASGDNISLDNGTADAGMAQVVLRLDIRLDSRGCKKKTGAAWFGAAFCFGWGLASA